MFNANISNRLTSSVDSDDIHLTDVTVIFLILVILITAVISIVGNTFTCLIVYKKRTMRSAINLLLINIALADMILALTVMPFVLSELFDIKVITFSACVSISVLKDVSLCSASYTLLLISIDRYLIIVHRKDRLCPKCAKIAILAIWGGSLLLTGPQFLSFLRSDLQTYDELLCNLSNESFYNNFKSAYKLLLTSLIFYGPMAVMCFTYASIFRTVQLTSKKVHDHSGSTVSVSVTQYSSKLGLPPIAVPYRFTGDFSAKRKAFGTILILFVTLFCCWCPYMTCRIANWLQRSAKVRIALLAFAFAKSALYPVIFIVRNKKFRVACLQYLPVSSLIKLPRALIYGQRVNPKSPYQCPDIDTRI